MLKYCLPLIFLCLLGCAWAQSAKTDIPRMNGLSFVAPPYSFQANPMQEVQTVGADFISVIPIAYGRIGKTAVRYNIFDWQWWGERPEGVAKTIDLAHESNIGVLLKPQVYIGGSWPGAIDFDTNAEWEEWEAEYRKYLMPMVQTAQEKGVKIFCIGTEFKISTQKRDAFWRQLIKDIRKIYDGKLTYAANWDEYKHIKFWDELDFIGIDAYFPLIEDKTPAVAELQKAWQKPIAEIENVQKQFNKAIIFTEYGYMSVDGCAGKVWEIETKVHALPINEQAQANAIEALHRVFAKKDYWKGGFLWKWFPEMQGHEGYPAKDYTPQGKAAENTLRQCFEL